MLTFYPLKTVVQAVESLNFLITGMSVRDYFKIFTHNISFVPQGVTVADIRRELTFCKKTKIPIQSQWSNKERE